jgi:hypothetical protein
LAVLRIIGRSCALSDVLAHYRTFLRIIGHNFMRAITCILPIFGASRAFPSLAKCLPQVVTKVIGRAQWLR